MISTASTINKTTHPFTASSSSSKRSVCRSPDATSAVVVGLLEVEELLDVRVNVEEVTDNDVEENVILLEVEELLDVRVNVEEEEVAGKIVEENVMLPEVEELLDVRVNVEEDVSVELLVVAEDGITKVEMNSATSVDPSPVMSIGL
eukprot:s10261_g2.t1